MSRQIAAAKAARKPSDPRPRRPAAAHRRADRRRADPAARPQRRRPRRRDPPGARRDHRLRPARPARARHVRRAAPLVPARTSDCASRTTPGSPPTRTAGSPGEVAPLLLSTGPGALTSLAALQEAAAASAPVLAISSQIPTAGLGGGRHGYLHELRDQQASFRGHREVRPHGPDGVPDPVRDRRRLGVRADRPARPGLGGDPAGRAARRDHPPRRSRAHGRHPARALPAPRADGRGGPPAVERRPARDHRGRRSRTVRRVRQAARAGGEARRPRRHHLRRQGRLPLGAPALAPVLAGGPAHDRLPGGRGRPAGRRLRARRALLELPHVPPARPGDPDRGGRSGSWSPTTPRSASTPTPARRSSELLETVERREDAAAAERVRTVLAKRTRPDRRPGPHPGAAGPRRRARGAAGRVTRASGT